MKVRKYANWATVQTNKGWVGMSISQLKSYADFGNNDDRIIAVFYYYRDLIKFPIGYR